MKRNFTKKEADSMNLHKKHLILMGMMGTGKSTVGHHLAQHLPYPAIDLDHWIEEKQNQSIPSIFEEFGESYFRELESQALKHFLKQSQPYILITGGGIIIRPENRKWMKKESGAVFHLIADVETLIQRLELDVSRPLLQGDKAEKIRRIWSERKSLYESIADYQVQTDDRSPESITTEILSHWYQLPV
ncbi:shikimate kinase [Thermoactinomyces sp. DSM 45892]|uniref:shikimate kinase n=1 Tax=Thermoactinomyces sp. DSM 45892 TaxID=1882753 RepID=UPI00089BF569|nr:shikimate kinase [Thermoactinomyces sp. DSM 45892]SDY70286.1 shikimate kinase [Thermoactinomyces sp. DSM 45892]